MAGHGGRAVTAVFFALLAKAYGNAGQAEEGLSALNEALEIAHNTGERWWDAELYRLKGELLLRQTVGKGGSRTASTATAIAMEVDGAEPGQSSKLIEAETCFLQALDIAQRQQAKSLELWAALSMSELWQRQGKNDVARGLLAETYGWFTEGFDTADLKQAKALLDALS